MPKKKSPGMPVQKILKKIRPEWVEYVGRDLARGMEVRAGFEQQLDRFFDLLEQSVATGDPAWMDSILLDWAKSSTETNLEEGLYHVSFIINRMIALTIQVANETLTKQQSIDMLAAIIPVYTYGLGVVARYEMETRVAHISDEMQQVQKQLERIDRSKSAFISVAAHELKTPLTLIEGYASMMDDLARDAGDSGMGKLLAGINIGIERLQTIVDDMIDVSMIDNNLLKLNFQPAQVGQIVAVLRNEVTPILQSRKLQIETSEFEGGRQWIYVDTQRVTQAIRNVISNAVKYTPDNGKITISGRMLPGFIEVVVEDTGIGISQEHQSIIFEKFGQVGVSVYTPAARPSSKAADPAWGFRLRAASLKRMAGRSGSNRLGTMKKPIQVPRSIS
jgi:signal transduction histidine kinase